MTRGCSCFCTLVVAVAPLCGKYEARLCIVRNPFQYHDGSGTERPNGFARFRISQHEHSTIEVQLRPTKTGNLVPPVSGQSPEADDGHRLRVRARSFDLIKGGTKARDFFKGQESLASIIRLSNGPLAPPDSSLRSYVARRS